MIQVPSEPFPQPKPRLFHPLFRLLPALLCAVSFLALTLPILAATPGDLDPSFGNGGIVTTTIGLHATSYGMVVQPDGKIVLAGDTTANFAQFYFALARYNPDGSLDPGFGAGGIVTTAIGSSASGRAVALQSDGKVVVGGSSVSFPNDRLTLARYTITGTLDNTFGQDGIVTTSLGSSGLIRALAVQSDGKIVAAGSVVARYTISGSLDSTFGINGIVTPSISSRAVALQPNDKVIIAGRSSNSSPHTFGLARYTVTGTLDSTFGSGGVVTTPIDSSAGGTAITIQSDGKLVVVGTSDDTSLSTKFALARYTITGSLDSTFSSDGVVTHSVGSSASGNDVVVQNDRKIVIAGAIINGGPNIFALARFQSNGSLDSTFGSNGVLTTPTSGDAIFAAVALDSNGKIVAAGSSSDGSQNRFTLIRYLGDEPNANVPRQVYLPVIVKP